MNKNYERLLEQQNQQLQKKLEATEKILDDTKETLKTQQTQISKLEYSILVRLIKYKHQLEMYPNDSRRDAISFAKNNLSCVWTEAFKSNPEEHPLYKQIEQAYE